MSDENRNICYWLALFFLVLGAVLLANWHGQVLRAERAVEREQSK